MNKTDLEVELRSGAERLHVEGDPLELSLLDFWRWSASDLLSNVTRGRLAEFIVASALGVLLHQPRDEWAPWDLTTSAGVRIEVKSCSHVQSWTQRRPSKVVFDIPQTVAWNREEGRYEGDRKRQADVYVFALFRGNEAVAIDPLDVGQWAFWIVPTPALNVQCGTRKRVTERFLDTLVPRRIGYLEIRDAVNEAAEAPSVAT